MTARHPPAHGHAIRVATWNLQAGPRGWAGRLEDRARLLDALDTEHGPWTVLFAQEVPPGGFDQLADTLVADDGAWAWHDRPGKDAATATGTALLVRRPWRLADHGMLDAAPSPKRPLAGQIHRAVPGRRLAVLSAALPPGGIRQGQQPAPGADPWGARKAEQAHAIADWVDTQRDDGLPVVVGIDANAPATDPPDWNDIRYWWDAEARLLGPDAAAKDAYRLWLDEHPDELARLTQLRPHGPLACTHLRGNTIPARYDHLLVSDDVGIICIDHVVADAFAAGSDHALVHAQVALEPPPSLGRQQPRSG